MLRPVLLVRYVKYEYIVKSPEKRGFGYRDPHPNPWTTDGIGAAAVTGDVERLGLRARVPTHSSAILSRNSDLWDPAVFAESVRRLLPSPTRATLWTCLSEW